LERPRREKQGCRECYPLLFFHHVIAPERSMPEAGKRPDVVREVQSKCPRRGREDYVRPRALEAARTGGEAGDRDTSVQVQFVERIVHKEGQVPATVGPVVSDP